MVCFFSPTHRLEDVDIQEQVDRLEDVDIQEQVDRLEDIQEQVDRQEDIQEQVDRQEDIQEQVDRQEDIQEQVDRQEDIQEQVIDRVLIGGWLELYVCPVMRQEAGEVYRQEAGWACPVCGPGGDDGGITCCCQHWILMVCWRSYREMQTIQYCTWLEWIYEIL